ncbi:hypothetical protein J6590_043684 [Homalodisca vitripennis]|nr:hypothetical protein J6590_043684 [Homalodisca vitripennis]
MAGCSRTLRDSEIDLVISSDFEDSSECSDVPELCEVVGGIEDVVRSDYSGSGSDGEPDDDLHQVTAQQTTPRPAYDMKKDLLRGEAEINLDNFNEAKTCIENELELLLNNAVTAVKKAQETSFKAKFAAKKVKALKVAAEEVEMYSTKTQEASAEIGRTLKHMSESIDSIELYAKKDLESYKKAEDNTFKEMKKENELIHEIKTDLLNQTNLTWVRGVRDYDFDTFWSTTETV